MGKKLGKSVLKQKVKQTYPDSDKIHGEVRKNSYLHKMLHSINKKESISLTPKAGSELHTLWQMKLISFDEDIFFSKPWRGRCEKLVLTPLGVKVIQYLGSPTAGRFVKYR